MSKKQKGSTAVCKVLHISCRMLEVPIDKLEKDAVVWYTLAHNPHTACGPFKVLKVEGEKIKLMNVSGVPFYKHKLKAKVTFYAPAGQKFESKGELKDWGP